MREPVADLREEARRAGAACQRFEADLSALVDGERTSLDGDPIARHVEECEGCRSFVNALAGLSRMHLFGANEQAPTELPAGADSGLWGDLTRRLLADTELQLATVLYELGKALVASGLRTASDLRGVQVFARAPRPIRPLAHKGQTLFRAHRELRTHAQLGDGADRALRRGIPATGDDVERVESSVAFSSGRACLEQCLRLKPDHHAARIYLAKCFSVAGRYDRARQLLRAVLHSKSAERERFFALQQLGRVYAATRQFARAIDL